MATLSSADINTRNPPFSPGQDIELFITASGNTDGTYWEGPLKVNGETIRTISAVDREGSAASARPTISFSEPGDYDIEVGNMFAGTARVRPPRSAINDVRVAVDAGRGGDLRGELDYFLFNNNGFQVEVELLLSTRNSERTITKTLPANTGDTNGPTNHTAVFEFDQFQGQRTLELCVEHVETRIP